MKKIVISLATVAFLAAMASCSESELNLCECGHGNDKASCYLHITDVNKEGYPISFQKPLYKSLFINITLSTVIMNGISTSSPIHI